MAAAGEEPVRSKKWRLTDFVAVLVGGLIVYGVIAFFVVTDRQRIAALLDEIESGIERQDVAAATKTLEGDVQLLSPGGLQEAVSAEVMRQLLAQAFETFSRLDIQVKKREIVVGEGTARVQFRSRVEVTGRRPVGVPAYSVRGSLSLRKHGEETWKINRVELIECKGIP